MAGARGKAGATGTGEPAGGGGRRASVLVRTCPRPRALGARGAPELGWGAGGQEFVWSRRTASLRRRLPCPGRTPRGTVRRLQNKRPQRAGGVWEPDSDRPGLRPTRRGAGAQVPAGPVRPSGRQDRSPSGQGPRTCGLSGASRRRDAPRPRACSRCRA